MPLKTTCIGAYPKPDFVKLPDWFNIPAGPDTVNPTLYWEDAMRQMGDNVEIIIAKGVAQVIQDQVSSGVDVPTDGEVPRENYIHYHCRHIEGISFTDLTEKEVRGGTYTAKLPTVVGKVRARDEFLVADWKRAQACTDKPVKMTMPGPMTITDTTANAFYDTPEKEGADLADAINVEVRALAEAGCKYIQIDEPLFARKPQQALDYGIENIERAFHRCRKDIVRVIHVCCGYPDRIDRDDYPKADKHAYFEFAKVLDESNINQVSLEDAHRNNDLSLLEMFANTTVIFGVVAIAKSRVESMDEIRERLVQALGHIDNDRLIAAPDCGLGILGRELAMAKLKNMCDAAKSI